MRCWKKNGILFTMDDLGIEWMQSHTQTPVPYKLKNGNFRIYFSSRMGGKSLPTYADLDYESMKIVYINKEPLLSLGEAETFDDSGIMSSSVIENDGKLYMYYIGWNQGVTVSYQNSIGLAISEDGGKVFKKYSKGPLIGRSINDPLFVASPFVIKINDKWMMYYLSCAKWIEGNGKLEPVYHIKYALSEDGIKWDTGPENVCIAGVDEAMAEPCVLKERDRYVMWYSRRKSLDYRMNRENTYRIGYAESADGFHWTRKDNEVGIDISETGWDSEMIAYAYVVREDDRYLMFYNGNGFGQSGIGWAESVIYNK